MFSEEQEQRKRVVYLIFQVHLLSNRPEGMIVMVDGVWCTREAPWEPPGRVEGLGCPDMEQSSIFPAPQWPKNDVKWSFSLRLWVNYPSTNKCVYFRII